MKKIFILSAFLCLHTLLPAQLYVQSGATLHIGGTVTLHNADLVNNGNISNAPNGRFVFTGTSDNDISGSSVTVFNELEIAKSGTGKLLLKNDIKATGKIIFTSNQIDLNNYNIDLGNGILEGESETSRITGTGGGRISIQASLNSPSTVNPGNLGAVITFPASIGEVNIYRGHVAQTNGHGTGNSIQRYFDIVPVNTTGVAITLRMSYRDAEKNGLDENSFVLFGSQNNTNWTDLGGTRDTTSNWVEQSAITLPRRFTISQPDVALPVTGLQLSGQWKNNASWLQWQTQTEINNSYFDIERKYTDDLSFTTVGRKQSNAQNGNSQNTIQYSWTDPANSAKGIITYRLKQVDINGKANYSNITVIRPEASSVFIKNLYPNISVAGKIYIQTGNFPLKEMQIKIYDAKGSLLMNRQVEYGSQWITLPSLSAGIYYMNVQSGEHKWSGSFIK